MSLATSCLSLAMLLIAAVAPLTTYTRPADKRLFEISGGGRLLATVTIKWTNEAGEITINRPGQAVHSYNTFFDLYATTLRIGGRKVLGVYTKEGRVDTRESSFQLKDVTWAERGQRSDVAGLQQQLAADMRILRAVRAFDRSTDTDLFELAFVIATADVSIRESAAPPSLQVREIGRVRATKAVRNIQAVRVSTVIRQDLSTCKGDCATVRKNCTSDARVTDPTACYTSESNCIIECHKIYKDAPAPEAPPEN